MTMVVETLMRAAVGMILMPGVTSSSPCNSIVENIQSCNGAWWLIGRFGAVKYTLFERGANIYSWPAIFGYPSRVLSYNVCNL